MEFKHVSSIAEAEIWGGMHLKEESCSPESLCCQGHAGHKAAVATGLSASAARALHAVGAVHDDGRHDFEHVGDVAEIDNKVVVAEGIAAFGQPNFLILTMRPVLAAAMSRSVCRQRNAGI